MPTNKDIARVLKDTAALIELTGGNEFRARAFSSAARIIERLDEPVFRLIESGELKEVRGIGSALAAQIAEIVERGTFDVYEDLLNAIPPGLTEVLRIKGLGGKKVRKLWQSLGITNLEELEEAATIGRLADLPGFGAKSQENVLEGIKLLQKYGTQRHYAHAVVTSDPFLTRVRESDGVSRAEYAGEMRRKLEIVAKVDIVAGTSDRATASSALAQWLEEDGDVFTGKLPDGIPFNVYLTHDASFGTELWSRTGSESHVEGYVARHGSPSAASDEAEVYTRAGLAVIPAEIRENDGEIEAAEIDAIPNLIRDEDIQGSLHNHSTYSDGAHTLRQMVDAARSMGYSYYAACDHSQSLVIANGMTIDRVWKQQAEIRALNQELSASEKPFRLFSGIESDILHDGSLDYPEEVLASFDVVVASVHSRFNMTREEATARIIRAVENPHTTILGHPTGRLLLRREGYPIDHARVIDACAANGVVIEINANPRRLDIDWRWVRRATDRGIMIAIDPDAHSIDELYYMRWGIAVARKGWLEARQCLNALPLDEFSGWIETRRSYRQLVTQV